MFRPFTLVVFLLVSFIGVSKDKATLEITVQDFMGEPLSGITVSANGMKKVTDSLGVVLFGGLKRKSTVSLVFDGNTVVYKKLKMSQYMSDTEVKIGVTMDWTESQRQKRIEQVRRDTLEARERIFASTDYSLFADCDDSTGMHQTFKAQFPGGTMAMNRFLIRNVQYPIEALDEEEQGRVYVSFLVDVDGVISDIKVEKGVSKALDAESVRVIRSMPRWVNGFCNGTPVSMKCRLPIIFTLH